MWDCAALWLLEWREDLFFPPRWVLQLRIVNQDQANELSLGGAESFESGYAARSDVS